MDPRLVFRQANEEFRNRLKDELEQSYLKYLLKTEHYIQIGSAEGMYNCFTNDYVTGLYGFPEQVPFRDIEPLTPEQVHDSCLYNHLHFLALKVYDTMLE